MYDAIILAGGTSNKQFDDLSTEQFEALIDIDGKPMVSFVAEALAKSRNIDHIYIIGPEKKLSYCDFPENTTVLEGGPTIIETIVIGMQHISHSRKVLLATSDIPLLTADAVDDFLLQCRAKEADLYYPIIRKEVNEYYYPGNQRTYVRLKEGVYTGGNLLLINPAIVSKCLKIADRVIKNRKNPLKLCHILGWRFVFKFLFRCLALPEVEARVSSLLAIKGTAIQSSFPGVGIDVDKPSDLELVRTAFSVRT